MTQTWLRFRGLTLWLDLSRGRVEIMGRSLLQLRNRLRRIHPLEQLGDFQLEIPSPDYLGEADRPAYLRQASWLQALHRRPRKKLWWIAGLSFVGWMAWTHWMEGGRENPSLLHLLGMLLGGIAWIELGSQLRRRPALLFGLAALFIASGLMPETHRLFLAGPLLAWLALTALGQTRLANLWAASLFQLLILAPMLPGATQALMALPASWAVWATYRNLGPRRITFGFGSRPESLERFDQLSKLLAGIASERLWCLDRYHDLTNVVPLPAVCDKVPGFRFMGSRSLWEIEAQEQRWIFFPESVLLLREDGLARLIPYELLFLEGKKICWKGAPPVFGLHHYLLRIGSIGMGQLVLLFGDREEGRACHQALGAFIRPLPEAQAAPAPPLEEGSEAWAREILNLPPQAEWSKIQKSYRAMARRYHPDQNPYASPEERAAREKRMVDINRAHDVLKQLLA